MNREEMIETIASNHGLSKVVAADILKTVLTTIQDRVIAGDRVSFYGFGTFEAVNTKARTGHSPRTGKPVAIAPKRRPKFTAGRAFKHAVTGEHNGATDHEEYQ